MLLVIQSLRLLWFPEETLCNHDFILSHYTARFLCYVLSIAEGLIAGVLGDGTSEQRLLNQLRLEILPKILTIFLGSILVWLTIFVIVKYFLLDLFTCDCLK